MAQGHILTRSGSSPLTRGKPYSAAHLTDSIRLIPAHAGKTGLSVRRRGQPAAHPRSRGENSVTMRTACVIVGSSPLTRGKRQGGVEDNQANRLIPAHAGKTSTLSASSSAPPAHPRSRGENLRQHLDQLWQRGSSPLTRGKQTAQAADAVARRLIPAHAGKTPYQPHNLSVTAAHPRSRGENKVSQGLGSLMSGSSPLTRGKHRGNVANAAVQRLIPAHAGKTR